MMMMTVMNDVKDTLSQYITVSNLKKKHVSVTLLMNETLRYDTYSPSMWWLHGGTNMKLWCSGSKDLFNFLFFLQLFLTTLLIRNTT